MKKVLSLLVGFSLLITVSLSISGCGKTMSGDYPYYSDTSELAKEADVIVVGDVTKVNKAEKININADAEKRELNKEEDLVTYTVSDVKITEVIKGDVKVGDTIRIKQLGDKNNMVDTATVDNGGYLKKDSDHVFFLKSYIDINPDMPYSLLNPAQGQIEFSENTSKVGSQNKLFKSNSKKEDILKDIRDTVKNSK